MKGIAFLSVEDQMRLLAVNSVDWMCIILNFKKHAI